MSNKVKGSLKICFVLAAVLFLAPSLSQAGDSQGPTQQTQSNSGTAIEFVSTGEGDRSYSDMPTTDNDPYINKQVKESEYAGHKSTQREYKEECDAGDSLCNRAKQRQLGGSTY